MEKLKQMLDAQGMQKEKIKQFIERVHRSIDLDELTLYALREFVKAIC